MVMPMRDEAIVDGCDYRFECSQIDGVMQGKRATDGHGQHGAIASSSGSTGGQLAVLPVGGTAYFFFYKSHLPQNIRYFG